MKFFHPFLSFELNVEHNRRNRNDDGFLSQNPQERLGKTRGLELTLQLDTFLRTITVR